MKKLIKCGSIIFLMIFSFYYTEKVAIYVQNTTPLKREIKAFKEDNIVSSINAKIDGDEIVPGLNGLTVNVEKSYQAMKLYNLFNESSIVYDEVKPNISVKDYPQKTIRSGNTQKKAVSIIISSKNKNISYLRESKVNYTYKHNSNYCIITSNEECGFIKHKVKVSVNLNNTNFIKNIVDVKNGSIIYLDDDLDKMFIDILIQHINFYNLKILPLDEHLSENYSF